jgi:6-phosphofructokinase 1
MSKRIGILTGGGDCPGLNAVIRAVVKHANGSYGWDVVGIEDAFAGLYHRRWRDLGPRDVSGLLDRGGTILGSSNRGNPFAFPVRDENGKETIVDVSDEVVANFKSLDLEALVVVGGDGTMMMAADLMEKGIPVVGVPKTIDNDLEATEYTVGYQTALEIACDALDRLHTTAESHDRVIICEVMGRYAGWIAMGAGMSAGADVILIPEIEYEVDAVIGALDRRRDLGISFTIAVVAEGAAPRGGQLSVAESGDETRQERLGGAGQALAEAIRSRSDYDVRVTVLGHVQRGGRPCAFDRLLATRFGVKAVDLIHQGRFGQVAALRAGRIEACPMELAVSKLKRVDPESDLVIAARAAGVELGDGK